VPPRPVERPLLSLLLVVVAPPVLDDVLVLVIPPWLAPPVAPPAADWLCMAETPPEPLLPADRPPPEPPLEIPAPRPLPPPPQPPAAKGRAITAQIPIARRSAFIMFRSVAVQPPEILPFGSRIQRGCQPGLNVLLRANGLARGLF
jgi:hypothetical protein